MRLADVVRKYMDSGDCQPSEEQHYANLLYALLGTTSARPDVSELNGTHWKQIRYAFASGNWKRSDGSYSKGWSRNYLNYQVRRIQKAARWAAAMDLIPIDAYHRIDLLQPVRKGQTCARECEPIGPVSWDVVKQIEGHCSAKTWDMVRVQWLTGMRSNELVRLNRAEITRYDSQRVWLFNPAKHKTATRGKSKTIVIGPAAVDILLPYWDLNERGWLFVDRHGRKHLTPEMHYHAVQRAIQLAKCPTIWTPHQLRHARAQLVDRSLGREAACALLGNTPTATAIYAERNITLAIQAALEAKLPDPAAPQPAEPSFFKAVAAAHGVL